MRAKNSCLIKQKRKKKGRSEDLRYRTITKRRFLDRGLELAERRAMFCLVDTVERGPLRVGCLLGARLFGRNLAI